MQTAITASEIEEHGKHIMTCRCDLCTKVLQFEKELEGTSWKLDVRD